MAQIPRSRLILQIDKLHEEIKLLREELAYEKRNKISRQGNVTVAYYENL